MHPASDEVSTVVSSVGRTEDFRVLVVCTANQCRSPMAEFLLRQACSDNGLQWEISSAGTHAVSGQSMHKHVRRLLNDRGVPIDGWQTRRVDSVMVQEADVILTATRQHRALLVNARTELLGKTYPILRFAKLAEYARTTHNWFPRQDSATALLQTADRAELAGGVMDDLPDPMGKSYREFRRCAGLLDEAIDRILG
jgi:protein-tyrosine phosphatase